MSQEFRTSEIKVHYLRGMEEFPLKQIRKNAGVDCYAAEDVSLKKGDFKLIPLGFAMSLPYGTAALLMPRSSTFKKWGIIQTNSIGLIDESYSGTNDEWLFPVLATRDVEISKGDKICQFIIISPITANTIIDFTSVEELSKEDRGGFGTSGSR